MKPLSADQLLRLKDFIKRRLDLNLQPHQDTLLREYVNSVCSCDELNAIDSYIEQLYASNWTSFDPILHELCDAVTVGESYFFRDQSQMEFLHSKFLPELILNKRSSGDLSMRIVSAGCSAGQELYTILIMLHQLLPDFDKWHIDALGIDICESALKQAKQARYGVFSFRSMPHDVKESYFQKIKSNEYVLNDAITKPARFIQNNIRDYFNQESIAMTVDLVMCRNVFIYMEYLLAQAIATQMVKALASDGILLLGPSDIMHDSIEGSESCRAPGMIYYKRSLEKKEKIRCIYPDESESVKEYSHTTLDKVSPDNQLNNPSNLSDEELQTQEGLLEMAVKLADTAEYDEALRLVEKCLAGDELNPKPYFVRGVICLGLGAMSEAKANFKSAVFLDANFKEASEMLKLCQNRIDNQMSNLGGGS